MSLGRKIGKVAASVLGVLVSLTVILSFVFDIIGWPSIDPTTLFNSIVGAAIEFMKIIQPYIILAFGVFVGWKAHGFFVSEVKDNKAQAEQDAVALFRHSPLEARLLIKEVYSKGSTRVIMTYKNEDSIQEATRFLDYEVVGKDYWNNSELRLFFKLNAKEFFDAHPELFEHLR